MWLILLPSVRKEPIYGMPILRVDEAQHVMVCNLDTKPGYSGVDNPLYEQPQVTLLFGRCLRRSGIADALVQVGQPASVPDAPGERAHVEYLKEAGKSLSYPAAAAGPWLRPKQR